MGESSCILRMRHLSMLPCKEVRERFGKTCRIPSRILCSRCRIPNQWRLRMFLKYESSLLLHVERSWNCDVIHANGRIKWCVQTRNLHLIFRYFHIQPGSFPVASLLLAANASGAAYVRKSSNDRYTMVTNGLFSGRSVQAEISTVQRPWCLL